jgi:hypothetical protein
MPGPWFRSLGLSVAALVCAATSSLHAQTFTFQSFNIPQAAPGAENLSVEGINDFDTTSGDLVDGSGNIKAWVRDANGKITLLVDPLDTTGLTYTVGEQINDLGVLTGIFYDVSTGTFPGYFESNGKFVTYNLPTAAPGGETSVDALNLFGSFCGFTGDPPFTQINTFIVMAGKVNVFAVHGSTDSYCESINDEGFAAGSWHDSAGVSHGWVRNPFNGEITTIDAPGAATMLGTAPCTLGQTAGTVVFGINDFGVIIGHFWDTSYNEHGFALYPNGKFVQIDVPGATATSGGAVNNLGQVTGHYSILQSGVCYNFGYIATPK